MKTIQNEKGFTLVELAIVMAIIGLLIGGILKGQELMENARVASTVSQIKSVEAAVTTFRDTYSAMPGDLRGAGTRLPNCTAAACTPTVSPGDNRVGILDAVATNTIANINTPLPATAGEETSLFWVHLLLADLLGGITDTAIQGGAAGWGQTHPAAKIGGGFFAVHSDGLNATGTALPGRPAAINNISVPTGLVLELRNSVVGALTAVGGDQPVSPLRAGQIDRKIDDGQSSSGTVQGYGLTTSCFQDPTVPPDGLPPFIYNETIKNKDCGLIIQIQG